MAPSTGTLSIQPLFPLALGQVALAPDLLQTARQLAAIQALRAEVLRRFQLLQPRLPSLQRLA